MTARIRLQEAFKFALSMVLMYWLALWMDWDLARYGALTIVVISLSTSGASISKGVMRVIGTITGCVVGLILVASFSQARWSMMFSLSAYLIFISYLLQTSRYPYAWYVAGFVPLVIWADTYGSVENTFHFVIFRLLETTAGVLIYSVISVLLWPQTAGEQFYRQGGEYLDQLCLLLRLNQEAVCGIKNNDAPAVQRKLDALSTQLQTTLGAALNDTMVVREHKHEWVHALATLRALTDTLVLWRTTNEAFLRCNPDLTQPDFEHALEMIEQRCARIGELWQVRQLPGEASQGSDKKMLQTLSLGLSIPHAMANDERGLLITLVDQLRQLDQQSRKLLILLRVLSGLDSTSALTDSLERLPSDQAPRWDLVRFLRSLIPALAFIIGFLFWIYPTNPPPSGQSIAMMSGNIGLLVGLGANVRYYLVLLLVTAGLVVIAPVYFVVMPWLEGGIGLLTMIFLLSFTSGYLGGRWPMVKLSVMLLFIMSTNISNEQSYSFMGWISAEFMLIMAGMIVNTVVLFMPVIRPEKRISRQIRGFFQACAAVTRDFVNVAEKRRRAEHFIREVRRTPGELRKIERTLDYSCLPADARERLNQLLDSIESLSARLRVVKTLIERVTANASSVHPVTTPLGIELPRRLHRLFDSWAMTTQSAVVTEEERGEITKLYHELEERLEKYLAEAGSPTYNEQASTEFTALLGGVRGLLDVMAETDHLIHDTAWGQWAEARF